MKTKLLLVLLTVGFLGVLVAQNGNNFPGAGAGSSTGSQYDVQIANASNGFSFIATHAALTGQGLCLNNAASPTTCSPVITTRTVAASPVSADLIKCDSATAVLDRTNVVKYQSTGAGTAKLPDPSDAGCGVGMAVKVIVDSAFSAVTISRETAATLNGFWGFGGSAAQTSFVVNPGGWFTATATSSSSWDLTFSVGSTTTGTPSATTFLRGDNSWAVPSGGSSLSYWDLPGYSNANTVGTSAGFVNVYGLTGVPSVTGINHLHFDIPTANGTTAVCIYNSGGTLIAHTAATAFSSGVQNVATVESNVSTPSNGFIWVGIAGAAGSTQTWAVAPDYPIVMGSSVGIITATGAVCPSSITPPTITPSYNSTMPVIGFAP